MNRVPLSVSVAICTYNGADYIEDQLNSILSQTILPDEILVRDDGSSDDTIKKILTLAERSAISIKVMQNGYNLGPTRNFQSVIGDCSKEIIFLSDQDDVWFPEKIERMLKFFAENTSLGLVYSDARIVDSSLAPLGLTVFDSCGGARVWKGSDREPLDILMRPGVKGCTMAFRASFVRSILPIPESDGKPLWTHDYWITFMLHLFSDVVSIDEPLMYYRIHANNTSGLMDPNPEAIARTTKPYRSYYSTKRIRVRAKLYEALLAKADRALREQNGEDGDRRLTIRSTISRELKLLNERFAIWSERKLVSRLFRATIYLLGGNYGRFKAGAMQYAKDILGMNR